MNRPSPLELGLRWGASFALVAAATIYVTPITLVRGADAKTGKDVKAETKEKSDPKPAKSADKKSKKLTGSELYSIHCGRCHAERYPTEFTAAQWQTVVFEMRVRANLPAVQAKAILKYLQEDSGTP
jgi:mono/diheme cytochrome c family protein